MKDSLKSKGLIQRLHVKPSTALKLSKTATFVLMGIISIQAVAGGLLWYAGKIKATAGSVTTVRSFPQGYGLNDVKGVTTDSSGNTYVAGSNLANGVTRSMWIRKFDSAGKLVKEWTHSSLSFYARLRIEHDASGNIYIVTLADPSGGPNGRVVKFDSEGVFQAQFDTPQLIRDIALDSNGYVYVSICNDHIQKYTMAGVVQADWTVGAGAYSCGDIAIDGTDKLYAADSFNHIVKKYDLNAALNGTPAATIGSYGSGPGQFGSIEGLATDSSNYLYVGDTYNNRVEKFDSSGLFDSQWTLPVGTGPNNFVGGSQYSGFEGIARLADISISANNRVLLADWYGAKVLEYNTAGIRTSQLGLYVPGNLGLLGGLAVAPDGSLYAFDAASSRMQKFDSSGNYLLQWGSKGTNAGQFNNDYEGHPIAVDSSGYVYVGDTGVDNMPRIQKFDSNGVSQAQWDVNWSGECGSGPVSGLAVGPNGHIYTVDSCNKVQEFTNTGGHLDSFGSEVTYDSHGMGFDASGNIYVVDGSTVKKYKADKSLEKSWGVGARAQDIAISPQGEVYVGMTFIAPSYGTHMVKKYDTNGVYSTTFSSSDPTGQIGGYLALDTTGKLYLGSYSGGLSSYGTYASWLSLVSDDTSLTLDAATLPEGLADYDYQAYSGVVSIPNSGRQGVVAFSLTAGALPAGMAIDSVSAQLTGTPTEAGDFTFTVTGQDAVSSSSRQYQLHVKDHVRITTSSLADGRVGIGYSQTLQKATDFPNYGQTYTYSVTAGGLPTGLSLNPSSGAISGTPSAVGSSSFTVQVAESFGGSPIFYDSKQLSINVSPSHQVTTLPASNVTEAAATLNGATNYPNEITARGFQYGLDTNYGTQVADNTVNPGYKVASSSTIAASSDLQANYASYGMTVDASGNRFIVDTTNNQILKYSKSGALQETWGSAGSGDGEYNHPTDIAISPDRKFYIVDDHNDRVQILSQYGGYEGQFALPTGDENTAIAIDSTGSVYVTGMNASGPWYLREYRSYINRYNASGTVLLHDWTVPIGQGGDKWIYRHPPYDLGVDANDDIYVVDSTYHSVHKINAATTDQPILTIGGTGPGYYGNGTTNGQFTTPTAVAVDASNDVFIVDSDRIQKFNSNGQFILSWYFDQSDTYLYRPHSLWAEDDGNVITASWDWTEQGQPQLITYSSAIQANISGLTCGTTYHYRAYAANADGTEYGSDATFTTSACYDDPINITTTSLQGGTQGSNYQDLVNVEFATGDVTYSVASGALPDGLNLNSATGYITGTPLYGGDYNFTIAVADSNSYDTQSLSISVSTLPPPALNISTTSLPDATIWYDANYNNYDQYIYTENYVSDVNFTVSSGSLPPGLDLTYYGGGYARLSGTPTVAGTYTFTIQADDGRSQGNGVDTQEYTIVVPEPTYASIYIDTTTLSNAREGFSYNTTIYYQNARATPVFSLLSGSLPDGISLTLEGYLQGTPTTPGTYTFTVQVDDGFSTDTQELTLVVDPAPAPVVNTPFVSITSPGNNATFTGGNSTITGTGPANQTISIFVDGTQIGTTTANSEGIWSYSATGIAAGSHTFDAKWIPGAEVMFVPYLDMQNYRTNVRVYDTSTDQLIKEISLPFYSFALQAIVSPNKDKLFLVGAFEATGEGGVWEVDLNSAAITAYHSGGAPIISAVVSQDGAKLYTNSFSNVMQAFTAGQGFGDGSLTLSGGGYDAPALLKISEDGSELYAMVFDSNEHTPAPFTIKVINPADLTVLRSIDVTSALDPDHPEWASGFGVAGNVAYVPHSVKNVDLTGISTLRLYDLTTGSLLKTINISPLSTESGYAAAGNVYIDVPNNLAYLSAKDINLPGYSYILKVDLGTNNVQVTQLTSGQGGGGLLFLRGLTAAPSQGKLYLSPWLNGQPTEGVEVYNMATDSVLSGPQYPMLNPANSFAYAFGSNFIGPITPPKDSIAFSVPDGGGSTCEELGTCPQPCEVTNTCPPQPCAITNTCPKPCSEAGGTCPKPADCTTTTNTCPTATQPPVTPPATTPTPRIISTPQPSAATPAPSTSRLGWFDRGVLAVAHFVPAQAAIGFPFVLFVLLLLFALSLYYQSSNEIRKDKLNKAFLAKRLSVRAQQDNFIALASHYLNTPITIIQGGVEMVEDEGRGKFK